MFDGAGSKLSASPQREYVLAKGGPRGLLGVVNITAQVQVPVYLVSDTSIDEINILRLADALEAVVYVIAGEEKLQVGQYLVTDGSREGFRKIAVSGQGEIPRRTGVVRQQPGKGECRAGSDGPDEISTVIGCRGGAKARLGKFLDQVSDIGIAKNDVVCRQDLQADIDAICCKIRARFPGHSMPVVEQTAGETDIAAVIGNDFIDAGDRR
jgi:hypothetical protein